jgi:hypothetical protein
MVVPKGSVGPDINGKEWLDFWMSNIITKDTVYRGG